MGFFNPVSSRKLAFPIFRFLSSIAETIPCVIQPDYISLQNIHIFWHAIVNDHTSATTTALETSDSWRSHSDFLKSICLASFLNSSFSGDCRSPFSQYCSASDKRFRDNDALTALYSAWSKWTVYNRKAKENASEQTIFLGKIKQQWANSTSMKV